MCVFFFCFFFGVVVFVSWVLMSLSYVVNPEAMSVRACTNVWHPTAMRALVSDRAPFELWDDHHGSHFTYGRLRLAFYSF